MQVKAFISNANFPNYQNIPLTDRFAQNNLPTRLGFCIVSKYQISKIDFNQHVVRFNIYNKITISYNIQYYHKSLI